jgi:hypothetical protein
VPIELPHSGTVFGSGACSRMKASVCAPASSSDVVEARIASSSPDRVCISTTNGSMRASTSSSWWTTMSGPSATIVSSSSVTTVAISTITSLV